MARKTKEEALETRDSILNAAVEVFYEHGVAASSLEQIAETAGVTRGAVYWHFKNKLAIFTALHEQMHVSIMQDFIDTNASENPLLELKTFALNFLHRLQTDPTYKKIHSLFILKCDYSGELAPFLEEQEAKKTEGLNETIKIFEMAKAKGQISQDSDAHILALSFFCYMGGIITHFLRNPSMMDLGKNAAALIDQFFDKLNK